MGGGIANELDRDQFMALYRLPIRRTGTWALHLGNLEVKNAFFPSKQHASTKSYFHTQLYFMKQKQFSPDGKFWFRGFEILWQLEYLFLSPLFRS